MFATTDVMVRSSSRPMKSIACTSSFQQFTNCTIIVQAFLSCPAARALIRVAGSCHLMLRLVIWPPGPRALAIFA